MAFMDTLAPGLNLDPALQTQNPSRKPGTDSAGVSNIRASKEGSLQAVGKNQHGYEPETLVILFNTFLDKKIYKIDLSVAIEVAETTRFS